MFFFSKATFCSHRWAEKEHAGTYRNLKPTDWTMECDHALCSPKESLLQGVVLEHPDFTRPLILVSDALLDGLGAVLSQLPPGQE